MATEAKCPFIGGTHGKRNRDWWPADFGHYGAMTERATRSVKRNQPTIVSRRCHKDQPISGFSSTGVSLVGEARVPEFGQAQRQKNARANRRVTSEHRR